MSVGPDPERGGYAARLAAARGARAVADSRLSGAIKDFFLTDDARLDERTRFAVGAALSAIVLGIETDIRRHAARVLTGRGEGGRAEALLIGYDAVVKRLAQAGLLRDRELMDELIARVRTDGIAAALPIDQEQPEQPSLLIRLADRGDGVVAGAAKALLAADARRRDARETGIPNSSELPAELHHRLVWWIAASIREAFVAGQDDDPAVDRAIVEAAQRSLAAHDEGDRVESIALRLSSAIDARADELAPLLIDALHDRRLIFFVAILGRAIDLDYGSARSIVLEPEGDRLWLALRAIALDRSTIARIALALADADPRRDIERFADELDDIVAIPTEVARSALAPLTLHHDLRLAIDALARERER